MFIHIHQLAYDVNGYREDNSTVFLCGNAIQCLKVAQLQRVAKLLESLLVDHKSKYVPLFGSKGKWKRKKNKNEGRLSHGAMENRAQ